MMIDEVAELGEPRLCIVDLEVNWSAATGRGPGPEPSRLPVPGGEPCPTGFLELGGRFAGCPPALDVRPPFQEGLDHL
jgi:hypothetical protein